MAKERIVNVRFWRDNYILGLKPDARLLFLWAITNPATEMCGAYEAALSTIEVETGLRGKRIRELFDQFHADARMLYKDGWVIVKNFAKHQHGTSTNIKAAAVRTLNDCPDWVKDTVSNGIGSVSHLNLNLDLDSVRQPIPRPKPSEKRSPQAAPSPPTRGSRLPDRFLLTADMRQWVNEKRPDVDPVLETEKFCNHFRSAPGQKGVKLDWLLTWKNWILNARGTTNGTNNRQQQSGKATSVDRLRDTADVISQYPTEAELRRQP